MIEEERREQQIIEVTRSITLIFFFINAKVG